MLGATTAGEIVAKASGGSIDATQAAELMQEKCAGTPSVGSSGSVDDYTGVVTLDFVWSVMDAADQASMCDATEILGPQAAGALLADASEGMFSDVDSTAFLMDKCM